MSFDFDSAMRRSFDPTVLQLILFPTEQCNFRCSYCYEDFEIGRMKVDVVNGIKRLVEMRRDLTSLSILWFGGEPTIALDIVQDLSSHFLSLSQIRGFAYTADMTTNGYLLDKDRLKLLIGLGVRSFQISLDGPPQYHDQSRKLISGKGTYEKIFHHLTQAKLLREQFKITLRVHLNRHNMPVMEDYLQALKNEFLSDERFIINVHPVEPLSPNAERNRDALNGVVALQAVGRLNELLRADHAKSRIVSYGHEGYVCYASQPNSFAIRANGRLAKCTVALSNPMNDIGEIKETGFLVIEDAKHKKWLRGWKEIDASFLSCPIGRM